MTEARIASLPGGVHRITLPLPWSLDHVHCYALEDSDGWTIVDCGLGNAGTIRRWAGALEGLGLPRVRRVVITHYHPDHVGAGRPLVELTGAEDVVQGRDDAAITKRAWGTDVDLDALEAFLRLNGMPAGESALRPTRRIASRSRSPSRPCS